MVKLERVIVCLLIVALDVAAGSLGIRAEASQNKVKHLRLWIFGCRDPSHEAFELGLAAASLLALSHAIANLLGGCTCACSREEIQKAYPNRLLSIAFLLFSWVVLGIGSTMMGVGIWSNTKSRPSCGFTHHHFLSIGGFLCFIHGMFCVAYYVAATAAVNEQEKCVA